MKISKQIKSIKMYKLKQGVNLPKEFKIKVNPEQSEALQLHLLSVGYKYGDGSVNILKSYIFIFTIRKE